MPQPPDETAKIATGISMSALLAIAFITWAVTHRKPARR